MLSGSMMAALGQLAIPVPFVGAAVGGMIGYALSSFFYQSALEAARGVELSRQQLERVRAIESAARDRIADEQAALDTLPATKSPNCARKPNACSTSYRTAPAMLTAWQLPSMSTPRCWGNSCNSIHVGFEDFMNSDQPLIL